MSATISFNPDAPFVGGVHYFFVAPYGTTLPTDVGTEPGDGLDAAFLHTGYTDADGAQWDIEPAFQELFASQVLAPLRRIETQSKCSINVPLIEWSAATVTTAFNGGTVTPTANGFEYVPAGIGESDLTSAVLDVADGGFNYRLVIERGQVIGSVSAALKKDAFAKLPITYGALASVTNPTSRGWKLYSDNPAFAPAGS